MHLPTEGLRFFSTAVVLTVAVAMAKTPYRCDGGGNLTNGSCHIEDLVRVSLDESVKPCDDFYKFACGSWVAATESNSTFYSHLDELKDRNAAQLRDMLEDESKSPVHAIDVVKRLYSNCMDTKTQNLLGITHLLQKFKEIGHLPVLHGDRAETPRGLWSESDYNLTALLGFVHRTVPALFKTTVAVDERRPTRHLLQFDAADWDQLFPEPYRQLVNDTIHNLNEDAKLKREEEELADGLTGIIEFRQRYEEIRENRKPRETYYSIRPLSQMYKLFEFIDWKAYLRLIMPSNTHFYLDTDPDVLVPEPAFFERLSELLSGCDKRTIVNVVLWPYVEFVVKFLGERYQKTLDDYILEAFNFSMNTPRWLTCSNRVVSQLPVAGDVLFARKFVSAEERKIIWQMVEDIREAFIEDVEESHWLQPPAKAKAVKKLRSMAVQVGAPEMMYSDAELNYYFRDLNVSADADYPTLFEEVKRWDDARMFRELLEHIREPKFGMRATTVDANYEKKINGLVIPTAILQPPYYERSAPSLFNYAMIGTIIGQQIALAFDEKFYEREEWRKNDWDSESLRNLNDRIQCIAKQLGNDTFGLELPVEGGTQIQNAHYTNNFGVQLAYKVWRNKFSNKLRSGEPRSTSIDGKYDTDQLFYIAYAQMCCTHFGENAAESSTITLPRQIVDNTVMNQPAFAAAFECPADALMNPKAKCLVWGEASNAVGIHN